MPRSMSNPEIACVERLESEKGDENDLKDLFSIPILLR